MQASLLLIHSPSQEPTVHCLGQFLAIHPEQFRHLKSSDCFQIFIYYFWLSKSYKTYSLCVQYSPAERNGTPCIRRGVYGGYDLKVWLNDLSYASLVPFALAWSLHSIILTRDVLPSFRYVINGCNCYIIEHVLHSEGISKSYDMGPND